MSPAAAMRTYLLNNTGTAITSLIGSGTAARFYPDELAQNCDLPACTYMTMTTRNEHIISSGGTADWGRGGFGVARIEIECYGNTRSQSQTLADTILDYTAGPTQRLRGVYGGVNIFDCMVSSGPRTSTELATDGGDDRRYLTVLEFLVSFYDQ